MALRSAWLEGDILVKANAYHVDWTNQQVVVNLGMNAYDYRTERAGKSHLQVSELKVSHRVSQEFDWYTSLGQMQRKFDDFTVSTGGAANDLSGAEFAYAPNWTLAAGGTWLFDNGFFLNVNASWRDKAYADIGVTQSDYAIKTRTLLNANAGYRADNWATYIYASNLLDEEYIQYPRLNEGIALLGDPRVIGAILETSW